MHKSLLACSIIVLLAFSCQSSPSSPSSQEIRLNLPTDPPSLDPRTFTDSTSSAVIRMCFDGLLRKDTQGNCSLGVAKAVDISDDKLTYTFYLRDSFWSDGTPVTSRDFENTWKTILDPLFPANFANELYIIKNAKKAKENLVSLNEVGIRSLDDYTLQVELENPIPYFLDAVASASFFPTPTHIVSKNANWARNAGPSYVCNGPFYIEEWKHYNTITLKKSPSYWDRKSVALDKISIYMVENETTILSMYENNQLDWVGSPLTSLPSDALPILEKDKDFNLYFQAGTYYYIFNTKSFPFNSKHMRRAFSYAIHRKEIIENVVQGKQIVATSMVPPIMWKMTNSYFQDADLVSARKEFQLGLEELGITEKDLPPIKLSYNTSSGHHKIAQAIKEQWSDAFGIRVDLENMEWKVFLDNVNKHQFQIARMGGIATFNDPTSFLKDYQYEDSTLNHCQWSNETFCDLLNQSDKIKDPEKRMQILAEAEKIFIEEMPIAPIYFYTGSYLKKPYVKNVQISELSDIDFKYAYMEMK